MKLVLGDYMKIAVGEGDFSGVENELFLFTLGWDSPLIYRVFP